MHTRVGEQAQSKMTHVDSFRWTTDKSNCFCLAAKKISQGWVLLVEDQFSDLT